MLVRERFTSFVTFCNQNITRIQVGEDTLLRSGPSMPIDQNSSVFASGRLIFDNLDWLRLWSQYFFGWWKFDFILRMSHVGMERYWDNSTTIWCRFRDGFIFGNCTKGQEIVGEEPSNFSAAITVAGRVASLISIGTVCCWIRSTNNTFSFLQSLLLVLFVSLCERVRSPIFKISWCTRDCIDWCCFSRRALRSGSCCRWTLRWFSRADSCSWLRATRHAG